MKMKYLPLAVAALCGLFTAVHPAFAQNWTLTSAPSNYWASVASSADGSKLVAACSTGVYASTDSGATWTLTSAPSNNWVSVASSADGTKLVAAVQGGGIYTSPDSGFTWTQTSATSGYWWSVASSADGNRLVAGSEGEGMLTSTDSGASWKVATTPNGLAWYSIASSADGTKLVAGTFYGEGVYTSTNSGGTWIPTSVPVTGSSAFTVASSADGTKLVAAGGTTFTSSNFGTTWMATSLPNDSWSSVASSADGTKLVAVAYYSLYDGALHPGAIYISADSGSSWRQMSAAGTKWQCVAASADGTKWVAVVYGGGIYTFHAAEPEILAQPASQIIPVGATAMFSLGILGAQLLTYQWTSNNVSLTGATNPTYTFTNVSLAASGSFYAVNVSNHLGSALSSNAVLAVVPAIVTTAPANGISAAIEALNGSVWVGTESVVWFEWGIDTNYGNLTGVEIVPGSNEPTTISNILSGLNGGDTYHYRLVAVNDSGIVYGNNQSFVAGLFPSATTLSASGISTNGVTLNASINPNGPDTTVYFRWGTSTYYGNLTPVTDLGSGTTPVSYGFPLSGLTPGVIYHCQIVASNILGQTNGTDVSFLTGPWTLTTAPASVGWQSIASSADGNKLVAAGIFTSTNAGSTWQSNNVTNEKWTAVASSADGSKLVAAQGGYQAYGLIYTSTNGGVTWATNNAPTLNWRCVAASADGNKMVAVSGYEGRIYISTNAGASWISNAAPVQQWNSVASSADGTKLVAVAYQGRIGVSTNSGASWTLTNAPYGYWWSVASSADGSKLVAAQGGYPYGGYAGPIYVSTNSGITWTQTSAPFIPWFSVASSADGTKLAAAASGAYGSSGPIYTSTNSGATWTPSGAPYAGWTSIASSADGNKLAAACYAVNTGIYTLQTTPTPVLSFTPSISNAVVAWTIPSMNFMLQQNSNLVTTNWTDVPTPPVLNLTNLQNQVIVSPTNGNTFYLLKH